MPYCDREIAKKRTKGTYIATRTNLMWANEDNDSGITWLDAKKYCDAYRGGGYKDWRMPTLDELAKLYAVGAYKNKIRLTESWIWASENRGSDAAYFDFSSGERIWDVKSINYLNRALPVRSIK